MAAARRLVLRVHAFGLRERLRDPAGADHAKTCNGLRSLWRGAKEDDDFACCIVRTPLGGGAVPWNAVEGRSGADEVRRMRTQ